jgi:hypothetical protein
MSGVAKHVGQMQTDTGTKDKFAQYWIDILVEKARKMKSEDPKRSCDETTAELLAWYIAQPGEKFNPLLNLDSKMFIDLLRALTQSSLHLFHQALIQPKIPQSKSFTPSYLELSNIYGIICIHPGSLHTRTYL